MPERIEDYALIGNCAGAALVSRSGSIDWMALPRFDTDAFFAALLGGAEHGRWRIGPKETNARVKRRYREGTLVLETEFETSTGRALLIDCMDRDDSLGHTVRVVQGLEGSVDMCMDLRFRFEYGSIVPWVTRLEDGRLRAIAGPDQLILYTPIKFRGEDFATVAAFSVEQGDEIPFVLTHDISHREPPKTPDYRQLLEQVTSAWKKWSGRYRPRGFHDEAVLRSLITLKALSDRDTGGIVAACTTSLPEVIGGERNWDYRFCWLRDATFTLYALIGAGYTEEALAWRDWLVRAVAGSPDQMQILYGVAGERWLKEAEVPWLPGYEKSSPVRIGNAACEQLQLDVFGEVIDLLFQATRAGLAESESVWRLERALINHLTRIWDQPDEGIWEVRGGRRQFTHSKVMAWVAVDRGVRTAEQYGVECPLEEWRGVRERIRREICERGFNSDLNTFTQYFGGRTVDASLLQLPMVGFISPEDPRMKGTVAAIERELMRDGLVARYNTETNVDGMSSREGAFLACSFWLANNYVLQGRREEAEEIFERLLALRNDVGLLSEEYDVQEKRMLGNFPQAFSHVALINTASNLTREGGGPARDRSEEASKPHRS